MKYDMILCGVGGQGVISASAVIAMAGAAEGLEVRQSEIHGMAQRGGGVMSHLRLSDGRIECDLVPQGCADLLFSLEPLEILRYTAWLKPDGHCVCSSVPYTNISDYPDLDELLAKVRTLPGCSLVDTSAVDSFCANIVMAGAASALLPLRPQSLERAVTQLFARKGQAVTERNLNAFRDGRQSLLKD